MTVTHPFHPYSGQRGIAAREQGDDKDRVLCLRAKLIAAIGMTGAELTPSGSFPVRGMSPADLALSLEVWTKDGLGDEEIVAAVRAKFQRERERNPDFFVRSIRYFDGAIADHAARLKVGQGGAVKPPPRQYRTPKQAATDAAIRQELYELVGKDDPASEARKTELRRALNALKEAAV